MLEKNDKNNPWIASEKCKKNKILFRIFNQILRKEMINHILI